MAQYESPQTDHIPERILLVDIVARSLPGICGGPQEQRAVFHYLAELARTFPQTGDLIQAVLIAILGKDPATQGRNITSEYTYA